MGRKEGKALTPISRAGKSSDQFGFTLIELSVVLIILSIVLGMTLNFMGASFLQNDFKKDVRQFQGLVNQLRQEAMLKQKPLRLVVTIGSSGLSDTNSYVILSGQEAYGSEPDPKPLFSEQVTILGVKKNDQAMITSDKASITFTPQGLIEPARFFVMADGTRYTLSLEPFSSRIEFKESEQFL